MEPIVNYHIQKHTPPVSILSQIKPVQASLYHFLKIYFNTILPCVGLGLQSGLFPSGLLTKPCIHIFCFPYKPHAPHLILVDLDI